MMTKRKRWALMGAGLGLAVSFSVAAIVYKLPGSVAVAETSSTASAAPPAVPVTVALIENRDIVTWQEFSGGLEAIDRVQIRSRVAGAIQPVHFSEGALVKAGALLLKIEPEPYPAAVTQAEGQFASAQARMQHAATEFERGQTLAEGN